MANERISQLPSGAPAQLGDLIPIARAGANYSLTAQALLALATGSFTGSPSLLGNWEGANLTMNPSGQGVFAATTANLVEVFQVKLLYPFSFNTLTFVSASVSGSNLVGIGLYSAAGSLLVAWNNITVATNATKFANTPAGGATLINPGNYFWGYACSTTATVQTEGGLTNATSNETGMPWNQSAVRNGYATNKMSSGVMPSTLGTLTAGFPNSNFPCPCWVVEP